jgi:hypothetical protein
MPLAVSLDSLALGASFFLAGIALAGDFGGLATRIAARNRRANNREDGSPRWYAHLGRTGYSPESAWVVRAMGWATVAIGVYLAVDDPF